MSIHDDSKTLVTILASIKVHLDDDDEGSKLLQECKYLGSCIGKYLISAMTAYRLRKISKLTESSLNENIKHLKMEISELIEILTTLVSWRCGTCGKTVDAEHKIQLEMWIHAHKMICDDKGNVVDSAA
jgi:hypothetical protein